MAVLVNNTTGGPAAAGSASTYRAIVGGSGIVLLQWQFPGSNKPKTIAFARSFVHRLPKPVAGAVDVQPLDQIRPIEVVTAYAQGRGEIDLTLIQLYNYEAWQRLAGLSNSQDFVDISRTVASQSQGISITRVVNPVVPNHAPYQETFYNCVCTTLGDDDQVAIETMLMNRVLTFGYTHYIKNYINGGQLQYDNTAN